MVGRLRHVAVQLKRLDREVLGGRLRVWGARLWTLGRHGGEFVAAIEQCDQPGMMVLDVGAGEAGQRVRFHRARYISLDKGIGDAAWDYGAVELLGDALDLPLAGGSCDVVISQQVLEHVPEPERALREAHRVLRPGGRVFLSTNQSWPQHQKPHDYFRYTSFGLRYLFEKSGFAVERTVPMGGTFTHALLAQVLALSEEAYARVPVVQRYTRPLRTPVLYALYQLLPLAWLLDQLGREADTTLGWYCYATRL